jgi:predicted porin
MFKKLTLAALVLIFSGVTAAADDSSLYNKIDANKDGTINQKEASAYPILTEQWEELDTNADGTLDQAEFAKFEMMNK